MGNRKKNNWSFNCSRFIVYFKHISKLHL